MAVLEVRELTKKYGQGESEVIALDHVSFSVERGEFVAIIGASGSGKSTLMNMIGGLDHPTGGSVIIEENDISSMSEDELAIFRRRNLGIIYQFYNLIPTLTAYENVALMKDIVEDTMDPKEALTAVGLGEHMHQFPAQMSGGEQQRTSIARALAKNPRLLLCDEPTGALDTNTGRDVLELLVRMSREKKKTVVMVTHNSFFADIADKVIRVKNGGIESVTINEHPKEASQVSW